MNTIQKYFPDFTINQLEQFSKLEDLYVYWNEKINVISRKDIDSLYERHILHSLAIAKFISFKPNTKIIDIGTGGGFPGIPLAIAFPESNFLLIDSIRKKIKVVNAIIEELELKNVKGVHLHTSELKGTFDFVVSRAVTAFPRFVQLVNGKIREKSSSSIQNGIIYLKGGDLSEELKAYKKKVSLYPIQNYFSEEFFKTKYIVYMPIRPV